MFLGNPSARVRDELWSRTMKLLKGNGAALQLWSDNTLQGFSYRQCGEREREFVDLDGLSLILISRPSTVGAQPANPEVD